MVLFAGPGTSTVLVMFFAAVVLLTDSIHILLPLVESKRPHVSKMKNLIGASLGLKGMDKIHGWIVSSMMVTLLLGIWRKSNIWALICITILATAQPYFVLVAYYTKAFELKAPAIPVFYSSIFGVVGLMWREISDNFSFFRPIFIPVVTAWHAIISFTVLLFMCRLRSRLPTLKASRELENLKADALNKRAGGKTKVDDSSAVGDEVVVPTWEMGADMPTFANGFQPYPRLVAAAKEEQEATKFIMTRYIFIFTLLMVSGFLFGVSESNNHQDYITQDYMRLALRYITAPLISLQLLLITIYVWRPANQETYQMFDGIEGARSFA